MAAVSDELKTLVKRAEQMEEELYKVYALLYRYYCLYLGINVTVTDFAELTQIRRTDAQLYIHYHDQVHGELDYSKGDRS